MIFCKVSWKQSSNDLQNKNNLLTFCKIIFKYFVKQNLQSKFLKVKKKLKLKFSKTKKKIVLKVIFPSLFENLFKFIKEWCMTKKYEMKFIM